MELAIPLVALGGLYFVSNNKKKSTKEQFVVGNSDHTSAANDLLPNTDLPNRNYPEEFPVLNQETDLTSKLSTTYAYDGPGVYTDRYFDANQNQQNVNGYSPMPTEGGMNPNNPSYTGGKFYSLTGKQVDSSYYSHNNMVPYFGGHIRTRALDANSNESTLDNYVGSGSQIFNKSEQTPLFAPAEHVQWAYGAPNMNDFYQSRVNPSMRMANVKPFEEERVAPGLGLGYTTEGMLGYNSGMAMREAWLDRGVDELRVKNHQKHSYGLFGHEGPAMSSITVRGEQGIQNKNGQDKTFELGHARAFTTTGLEIAPTARAIEIEKFQNRQDTSVSYSGVAGATTDATYLPGEFMPSNHNDLGPVPFGGAAAAGKRAGMEGDYEMRAKFAYPNNRASNIQPGDQKGYFGAVGGAIGAVIAPLLDVLRPSRKENVIGNLRLYENAGSQVPSSYIYNPADAPAPTIRETTEINPHILGVNSNQYGGGYKAVNISNLATERDTTNREYTGISSASDRTKQPRLYDAEYNQRNNDIKSSTINGRMVPGNMDLFNADITARNRDDSFLKNNRQATMSGAPKQLFTPSQMGENSVSGRYNLYSNIQMDRNTPDILDAFRQNPYTHSLTGSK